jgi:tetratricopeptide (TPR) repeat protein
MAQRLPETLHVALMKGSRGLAHLLKQKSAGDLELLRASLAAAEQAGSHIYRTISRYFLGQWHFLVGEFAEALSHFEAALAISAQTGRGNLFQPGLLLWMAEAEARLGLHDAALEHLCRYDHLTQRVGTSNGWLGFRHAGWLIVTVAFSSPNRGRSRTPPRNSHEASNSWRLTATSPT